MSTSPLVSRMASWNSSFIGPMVAQTKLPKADMCWRPFQWQAYEVGQHLVDKGLGDVGDGIDGLAFPLLQLADNRARIVRNASAMRLSAAGESAGGHHIAHARVFGRIVV